MRPDQLPEQSLCHSVNDHEDHFARRFLPNELLFGSGTISDYLFLRTGYDCLILDGARLVT
jgi:hypothetical protein